VGIDVRGKETWGQRAARNTRTHHRSFRKTCTEYLDPGVTAQARGGQAYPGGQGSAKDEIQTVNGMTIPKPKGRIKIKTPCYKRKESKPKNGLLEKE